MNNRIIGISWCKIIAMFMICTLHYVGHGGVLDNDKYEIMGYLLKSFAITGVNLFMLATGYLMYDKPFRVIRVVRIWTETLFYSVFIGVIIGISFSSLGLKDFIKSFFPVTSIEYWYVTAYIILLLFSPVLNITVSGLNKKKAYGLLILITVFFSIWKSIFPTNGLLETGYLQGYGIVWMVCMYLFGAVMRKYPLSIENKKSYLLAYLGCVGCTFSVSLVCRNIHKLDNGNKLFDYNHFFVLSASVLLFLLLVQIRDNNIFINSVICKISEHTLAVYLIQEQFKLKSILWTKITDVMLKDSFIVTLLLSILSIAVVFLICILIDMIRKEIFYRLRINETILDIIEKIAGKISWL